MMACHGAPLDIHLLQTGYLSSLGILASVRFCDSDSARCGRRRHRKSAGSREYKGCLVVAFDYEIFSVAGRG